MKKLVFMFVAVAAISFASCGNQTKPAAEQVDSISEVDTTAMNDTTNADTTATDTTAVAE